MYQGLRGARHMSNQPNLAKVANNVTRYLEQLTLNQRALTNLRGNDWTQSQ